VNDISNLANLGSLKRLILDHNQLSDISALSNLTNLTAIWLDSNNITDLSPLSGLTSLGEVEDDSWLDRREEIAICLGLHDNQIIDIQALVDNEGLSVADGIDLRGNPLGTESLGTYLPQLEERGVNVLYDT
jgi:internalin A